MESKKCFKCGQIKPLEDFYKHPQMADGRVNKCKECNKKDVSENREKRSDYYHAYDRNRPNAAERNESNKQRQKENPESHLRANKKYAENNSKKSSAKHAVNNAIRDGKLVKLPCFICGELEVEGHHPDYDAPLDVVWLCVKHHKEVHKKYDREQDFLLLETTVKGSRYDA